MLVAKGFTTRPARRPRLKCLRRNGLREVRDCARCAHNGRANKRVVPKRTRLLFMLSVSEIDHKSRFDKGLRHGMLDGFGKGDAEMR